MTKGGYMIYGTAHMHTGVVNTTLYGQVISEFILVFLYNLYHVDNFMLNYFFFINLLVINFIDKPYIFVRN